MLRSGLTVKLKSFILDGEVEFEIRDKFIKFKKFDFYRLPDKFKLIPFVEISGRKFK